MKPGIWGVLLGLWTGVCLIAAAPADTLRQTLSDALASGKGTNVSWGALAVTGRGTVVFATNEGRLFIPASNTKLYTGALALDRFGAGQVLRTPIHAAARPDAEGVLRSDLWVVGQGDPTFGANPTNTSYIDPLGPLADRLHGLGIRAVEGDLVLCDAALRTAPYGRGWDPEDFLEWYGAPVSAFVVNDNTFRVVATPAEAVAMPALFRVEPDLPSLHIDWRVTTSTNRNHAVSYTRTPGSAGMRFTGRIPLGSKPWTPELAVADPARHFGEALRDALGRRGVEFTGNTRVVHVTNGLPALELMSWTSEPLAVRLSRCMKPSQNLHAQLLLAQVGADAARLSGDATNDVAVLGLQPMRGLLAKAGIPEGAVRLEEGSGLSRSNAVTPAATVQLLRLFRNHPQREAWMASMPVGGVDGTLRNRFRKGPAAGNVRAKTGGLRGVAALAGQVTTAAGEEVLFAIYANEAPNDSEARARIDRWVELIAAHAGRL